MTVPLFAGTNFLAVQGIANDGSSVGGAFDSITVTNSGSSALQPVIINEWMADNAGPMGFVDPADGLFQDWFELFNPNGTAFNLSGYFLTDNLQRPTKWRIPPNSIVAASGFLLVWADNETNQNTGVVGSDLHAAFQLNADGEEIGLFAPDGITPQSTVVFGQQLQNVSQGYFPDGNTNAVYFMTNFTPRSANTLAGPLQIVDLSFNGGSVSLTWSTIPGHTYRVEYKDDLSAPDWTALTEDLLALSETASATDTISPNGHRFYRVLRSD